MEMKKPNCFSMLSKVLISNQITLSQLSHDSFNSEFILIFGKSWGLNNMTPAALINWRRLSLKDTSWVQQPISKPGASFTGFQRRVALMFCIFLSLVLTTTQGGIHVSKTLYCIESLTWFCSQSKTLLILHYKEVDSYA